jgi:hypothetical protein
VNCSCPSTKPTPGPDDAGGATGVDGELAGCLEPHAAANPAAATMLAPAVSRPKVRRDILLMGPDYPESGTSSMPASRQSVKSILTDTGVVSSALTTLAPADPNFRPRATTSSSGLNFATPMRH